MNYRSFSGILCLRCIDLQWTDLLDQSNMFTIRMSAFKHQNIK